MKILFGVFDWGLGHATRDIPLIGHLLSKKHKVEIISTGRALTVLKKHFGKRCEYHDVPSLHNVYMTKGSFLVKCALSFPKILKSFKIARRQTEKIIERGFDKVISDARYDVYDKPENSYFIRHQLRFSTPFGAEKIVEKFLAKRMRHFKYFLVPDFPGDDNLTGKLSHNLRYLPSEKIKYIGIISHVKKSKVKENIDYFVSLSGPEETRKYLEKRILEQAVGIKGSFVIAGGNPDEEKSTSSKNIKFYSFLNSKKQGEMMNRAKFIIVRSGYTTVMELVELDKKALLIPSPGQTEQEYLGDYYEKKKIFHHTSQYKLNLKEDIKMAKKMKRFRPAWRTKQSISNFYDLVFS